MPPDGPNPEQLAPLLAALKTHFGYDGFLSGQDEAVWHATEERDVLVIMPTGSGKSLCYQLSAMMLPGITLVISPLISLMKDQVDGLNERGLPATFINSSIDHREIDRRIQRARAGEIKLLYIAPERFRDRHFVSQLKEATVSLIAIDEAHCISQWGHDFRPDYMRLRHAVTDWPDARLMALTATATPTVRADILRELRLDGSTPRTAVELIYGFARDNLFIRVTRTGDHGTKRARVRDLIARHRTGIVYCATRKNVDNLTTALSGDKLNVLAYHGGMSESARSDAQDAFMKKAVDVVVATNAFGMGIDRDDVRFVVHWDLPGSVEAYYQEIGRAGRDGDPAHCELLFNYADVSTQEFFIEGANPSPATLTEVLNVVRREVGISSRSLTRSIPEWADEVESTKSSMAVGSCLAILERAGYIYRQRLPGQLAYSYSVPPDASARVSDEIFTRLREKRKRDEQKLDALLNYISAPACRHAAILRYFGETPPDDSCDRCSNCVRDPDSSARPPTEEEWPVIQKILSCVGALNGRFGRLRVAQVLMGSKSEQILKFRLDQQSTYGLLNTLTQDHIKALIEELIKERCIEVSRGEYPVISLTPHGKKVAWRKAPIELEWPANFRIRSTEEIAAEAAAKPATSRKVDTHAIVNLPLYQMLQAWRKGEAKRRRIPAYTIFNNKTLRAISALVPDSHAALETCWGISTTKATQYGDAILDIIDDWREEQAPKPAPGDPTDSASLPGPDVE